MGLDFPTLMQPSDFHRALPHTGNHVIGQVSTALLLDHRATAQESVKSQTQGPFFFFNHFSVLPSLLGK